MDIASQRDTAPVALFIYNRLAHTQRTIDALRANVLATDSELVVFSDGAASNSDAAKVAALREYARAVTGFRSVTVVERDRNLGVAESVITGVTEMLGTHDRVIVVED